jgi:hypothetical protein
VLVYAANFLHEQHPALNDLLLEKAAAGCKTRIALGDPDSEAVRARGAEEHFGHGIETRCRVALPHYRPIIGVPGIEVHVHQTTLYNAGSLFDTYIGSFEAVWGPSEPAPSLVEARPQ